MAFDPHLGGLSIFIELHHHHNAGTDFISFERRAIFGFQVVRGLRPRDGEE
jgi:hypothetical protein